MESYIQSEGYTDFSVVQAGQGQALHIANYMANDARIAQDVAVEPNSFYCLSGQICAQAQGGRGANLSIADVYAFSAGIYDSQGEWRQVELYGQTGPRQRSLTVYARLGGYSGETSGEAWFTNLSLKKVESLPAGVEVTLFYQPSYSAETKTFSLDLRHLLLAVLVLLYGLMACQCYCFKSVLGLLMLSLGAATLPVTAVDSAGRDASALVDEPDTLSGEPSWYNGMYFDEIYHARTGYEHLHGLQPYEISHPPLGKVMISWTISIFGMTPFGWRFAGAACGVLMLPGMYLLGRLLFKKRRYAILTCLCLALDTMHFTQTRIATIDSFVVLFIIWSVYFMLRWFYTDFFGKKLAYTMIPLALSGACMGLAVASKWTGCFAGLGLAAIFFFGIWRRWKGVREAKATDSAQRDPLAAEAAKSGDKRLLITIASCLIFFVLVPAAIYYCSYIPYFAPSGGVTIKRIVEAAEYMLWYHSEPGRGMDHLYYAPWYRWPLSEIPMYYADDRYTPAGYAYAIWAFGNYAVWWAGFAALLTVLYAWVRHQALPVLCGGYREYTFPLAPQGERDARPALLLICFCAQYLPWIGVPRGTYIYHYFPSVPFIILCTAYVLEQLSGWFMAYAGQRAGAEKEETAQKRADRWSLALVSAYLLIVAAMFVAFYPFASGMMVRTSWLEAVNWFKNLYY